MAAQIVMDPTGDTRHEFILRMPAPWQKPSAVSSN